MHTVLGNNVTTLPKNQPQSNTVISPKPGSQPHVLSAKNNAQKIQTTTSTGSGLIQQQQVGKMAGAVSSLPQGAATKAANIVTQPAGSASQQQLLAAATAAQQGKVVLVNVGGQIMAAQNIGGKTVLMPQPGLNIVSGQVQVQPQQVQVQNPQAQAQAQVSQVQLQPQQIQVQTPQAAHVQIQQSQLHLQAQQLNVQPAQVQPTQMQAQPIQVQTLPVQMQTQPSQVQIQQTTQMQSQVQPSQVQMQVNQVHVQPSQVQAPPTQIQIQSPVRQDGTVLITGGGGPPRIARDNLTVAGLLAQNSQKPKAQQTVRQTINSMGQTTVSNPEPQVPQTSVPKPLQLPASVSTLQGLPAGVILQQVPASPTVPPSPSMPAGSLMMVGSGLTPVPTPPSVSPALTPTNDTSDPVVRSPLPQTLPGSPSFKHNMPQQVHMSRQAVAKIVPGSPPAISHGAAGGAGATAAAGGLEQLALAAVQVQEAMQQQKGGTMVKSPVDNNTQQTATNSFPMNLPNGDAAP